MIYGALAILTVILGLLVALQIYKARARTAEAAALRQSERARAAELTVEAQQHTAELVRALEVQQRERQRTDEAAIQNGDRSQFDTDW